MGCDELQNEEPNQQSGNEAATPSRKSSLVSASNLPDWTLDSTVGEHLWNDCTNSAEVCHISEECGRSGAKKKCSVCRITCHVQCIQTLKLTCRPTFREADIREYREEKKSFVPHHWVGRRRQESKCKSCAKSIQPMFAFSSKDMVAMQCTWCKAIYHNRPSCFSDLVRSAQCSLGPHASLIVPPNWIIKIPEKNSFKSSIRRASSMVCPSKQTMLGSHLCSSSSRPENLSVVTKGPDRCSVTGNTIEGLATGAKTTAALTTAEESMQTTPTTLSAQVAHGDPAKRDTLPTSPELKRISPSLRSSNLMLAGELPFVIKSNPLDAEKLKPLLVFLNPRSGGNQGLLLLRKFQWLLNPRQVFDLSQGGPRMGLELFNRIPNLRVLACGGDGTVGWVFSTIDELKINPIPPVAVLPLGTGNDLARTLRWGAGYADEPISKILRSIEQGNVVALDRWQVDCTPRAEVLSVHDSDEDESSRHRPTSSTLPLKVFNNYFSLGADAATALEFHESREANPEKFKSRLKNKIFYAGCGGRDLLLRSWRDLCDHVTLKCDGKDFTPLIRSIRPHVILFLNIPRYGSGTLPWGQAPPAAGFEQPRIDDGLIEVIGLSSTTLAMIQVGGHGDRICQCRKVTLTTNKVIPMQMDGEPCRLRPATLHIRCSHQALVVQKQGHQPTYSARGPDRETFLVPGSNKIRLFIFVISLEDYQTIPEDSIALRQVAKFYGAISVQFNAHLGMVRDTIAAFNKSSQTHQSEDDADETTGKGYNQAMFSLSDSWAFIDSTTAATRFFRIDQKKESSHFITDICNMEELFLIDSGIPSRLVVDEPQTNGNAVLSPDQSDDIKPDHPLNVIDYKQGDNSGTGAMNSSMKNSPSNPSVSSESRKKELSTETRRSTSEFDDRQECDIPVQTSSFAFNIDIELRENGNSARELEPEKLVCMSRLQQNDENDLQLEIQQRLAIESPSLVLTSDEQEKNEVVENPLEMPSENNRISEKARSLDQASKISIGRITDWLHQNTSCGDSVCNTTSERACEIELIPSDSEQKQPIHTKRGSCRNRAKHLEEVDSLQTHLNRALLNASRKGLTEQIVELLEAGANIMAIDQSGRSSLHLATKFGCEDVVRALLKYASPQLLELREHRKKQTALHKAAAYRRHNICQLLLEAGACPTARDAHGKRPRRLAYDAGDFALAHHLQREELMFTIAHGRGRISV